ncbi:MAG: hypothetical protein IT569_10455, partial [Leptospiraceae bacterium]|nr:hypothetical protein [Leptospiraceae bacterium]
MKNILAGMTKSFVMGVAFALGALTMGLFAVSVTGTIKTWATGDTLTATDINTAFTSLKTAVEGITSSQWTTSTATSSTIYYNSGNVGVGTTTPESKFAVEFPTTASYAKFGELRTGQLQSGSPFIALGVKKTAADSNYIATTNGTYGHSVINFNYPGDIHFYTVGPQTDGSNLNGVLNNTLILKANGTVG